MRRSHTESNKTISQNRQIHASKPSVRIQLQLNLNRISVFSLILASGITLLAIGNTYASEDKEPSLEYRVKAAFLSRFIQFTEWPKDALDEKEITIGVIGETPITKALEKIKKKKVKSRKLKVVKLSSSDDLSKCNLVFISDGEKKKIPDILKKTKDNPIMTVGETKDFCKKGGIMNFTLKDKKIRFEANPDEAKKSKLKINAKLLKLAVIVKTEKEKEEE